MWLQSSCLALEWLKRSRQIPLPFSPLPTKNNSPPTFNAPDVPMDSDIKRSRDIHAMPSEKHIADVEGGHGDSRFQAGSSSARKGLRAIHTSTMGRTLGVRTVLIASRLRRASNLNPYQVLCPAGRNIGPRPAHRPRVQHN